MPNIARRQYFFHYWQWSTEKNVSENGKEKIEIGKSNKIKDPFIFSNLLRFSHRRKFVKNAIPL